MLRRGSTNGAGTTPREDQQGQQPERAAAAAAVRTALALARPTGEEAERLEEALRVLEDVARPPQETLVAVDDLVAMLGAWAAERLNEVEHARASTAAAWEELDGQLAKLADRFAQLSERDEAVQAELDREAERRNDLLLDWDERLTGAREALERALSSREERDELETRVAGLMAATRGLIETRRAGIPEIVHWEQELAQIPGRITNARAAVAEAVSNPDIHHQLEERVAALREAESAEGEARRQLEQARARLETGLGAAEADFESAGAALADALTDEEEHKAELWASLNALGVAQRDALEALKDELSSVTALPGDAQAAEGLRAGIGELRNALSQQPDDAAPDTAVEILRPMEQLQRIRADAAAELVARLAEAERQVLELSEHAEQADRELGLRLAQAASELEARELELERARAETQDAYAALDAARSERSEQVVEELQEELSTSRRELEEGLAERDAELERARSALAADETDLERRLREAEEKLAATASEIESARAGEKAALEQVSNLSKELDDAKQRLGRRRVERRQVQESGLVEAIESVKRALTDEIDQQPSR